MQRRKKIKLTIRLLREVHFQEFRFSKTLQNFIYEFRKFKFLKMCSVDNELWSVCICVHNV